MSHFPKTPWPWPGGKADAAPAVWAALGDVDHYVEPFAGSFNGDWRRACTTGAMWSLPVRQGGVAGVFLDPPYSAAAGRAELYSCEDMSVAHECRAWALEAGRSPKTRIVLAGFEGEGHEELERHGWRQVEWYRDGFLKGGYGNQSEGGHQQARERLWMSPHCLAPDDDRQLGLL